MSLSNGLISVDARHELIQIVRDARSLLALPDNGFSWSSWADAVAALAEVDGYIAARTYSVASTGLNRDQCYPRAGGAWLFTIAPTRLTK